jgi:hypothetical protein
MHVESWISKSYNRSSNFIIDREIMGRSRSSDFIIDRATSPSAVQFPLNAKIDPPNTLGPTGCT